MLLYLWSLMDGYLRIWEVDPASMLGYIQTVPFAIYQEIIFNANKVLKQYLVLILFFFLILTMISYPVL